MLEGKICSLRRAFTKRISTHGTLWVLDEMVRVKYPVARSKGLLQYRHALYTSAPILLASSRPYEY